MNVRLLRRVAKHILAEPKRLAMGIWVDKKSFEGETVWDSYSINCSDHGYPRCGTAACIGGWTELLTNRKGAGDILGIDDSQAGRLFYCDQWPDKFAACYADAKTPRGKAFAAVARIEHFIKTRGKE